jgi:alpha-galactosidase
MTKITFIGAGSTVFAKNLLGDILSFPELADAEIALFDIDAERLKTSEIVAHKVASALGAKPTITATTDREAALDGADYALNMIQVGGYKPSTVIDFEIPKKYGLQQTIGDTLGVGGIMRALRTVPVLLEMAREMERLCPDVLHLNYVNPMAINCWALNRATSIRTVGLCHSVQHTAGELARDIGVPVGEINYRVAGINHVAFYLEFDRNGQDLYPEIQRVLNEGRVPATNRVRYEMFQRLGYFVTESSEHFSEYVPWFIKGSRPELIDRFNIPIDEYLRRCQFQISNWEKMRDLLEDPATEFRVQDVESEHTDHTPTDGSVRDEAKLLEQMLTIKRSPEYGSLIIHSCVTGQPRVVYGNVINLGLIDNLPECCVEVPCLVDKNGVQPTKIGALPPQLAALMQTNINVQALTVEAILSGKREHLYHAAMFDPHTSAELDLEQIHNLVDDLLEAHGDWVPEAFRSPRQPELVR